MDFKQLESVLRSSFEDFKLSQEEKHLLWDYLEKNHTDIADLNFARNKAFQIASEETRTDSSHLSQILKWLEAVVKTIDSFKHHFWSCSQTAYFSPGEKCRNKIIDLIKQANQSLMVCVFTISDDKISDALLEAKRRDLYVRVVTDNDKANDKGSDVYQLDSHGLDVRVDLTPNHMHHKFAIVDNRFLVNGSFNWTRSATRYNQENIVVSDQSELVQQFRDTFERLWRDCVPIK